MIDLSKSYDFFQPEKVTERIHIIGCGSVGSTIATLLVRSGLTKLTLWDFDRVEAHNVVNQQFRQQDVGKLKVEALHAILAEINPEINNTVELKPEGWQGKILSGYIFMAVDDIDVRRDIVQKHFNNMNIKAVFDFRTLLEGAQHYAADWSDYKMKQNLLNSMQFTNEEAAEETPVSACGVTLGVATTVWLICSLGVNNFLNFVKGNGIKKLVMIDGFHFMLDAF
ncbi:MAG: ThiF family adenylyltransferase [Oscillospiraceae bacterium]|nr:ThiF family adenylyltransferase [Oscillospiraceae bacterium]